MHARLVARGAAIAKALRAAYFAIMRRLFLALLVLLLATPAMAMPACAEPAATATTTTSHHGAPASHERAPAERHAMPDHGCLGCATPMKAPVEMAAERPLFDDSAWRPVLTPALVGTTERPALPPPRVSA